VLHFLLFLMNAEREVYESEVCDVLVVIDGWMAMMGMVFWIMLRFELGLLIYYLIEGDGISDLIK
jgi:hypothetical protein